VEGEEEVNGRQLFKAGASKMYVYKLRRLHPHHEWKAERQPDGKWDIYVTVNPLSIDDPWMALPKGPAPDRRLPAEPLLRQARLAAGPRGIDCGGIATEAAVADWLGCERVQFYKWKTDGIAMQSADKYATVLGLHVLNIWPDAYDDIDTEEEAA
jgi:hypothetical protein